MSFISKLILISLSIECYIALDRKYCGEMKTMTEEEYDGIEDKYPFDTYRWMTYVYRNTGKKFEYNKCIANIIDKDWLLTAASCLSGGKGVEDYKVKMRKTTQRTELADIDQIIKNPKYNPTRGVGYDLALIRLKNSLYFEFEETVRPICLVMDNQTVSGSAQFLLNELIPEETHFPVKVGDIDKCKSHYKELYDGNYMFCADKGVYIENNGAPLMWNDSEEGKYFMIAMASWGHRADDFENGKVGEGVLTVGFDVFTKLYENEYKEWIEKTINDNQKIFVENNE